MMESNESFSDEDFDQAELEAALYSQTHFDTSFNDDFLPKMQIPPSLEVHEVLSRTAHTQPTQQYDLGHFKIFSKDQNSNLNEVEIANWKSLKCSASEMPLKTVVGTRVKDVKSKKQNRGENSNSNETNVMGLPRKTALVQNQTSKETTFINDSEKKKTDSLEAHSSVKKKQNLLPFQITKKISNAVPLKTQFVVIDDEEEKRDDTYQEEHQKSGTNSKGIKKMPKIHDFLELSPLKSLSKQAKQKKLSKCEAAVKIRKPEVQLRRPPRAIPVRYRQDSDTETDYSDSDVSPKPTPTKRLQLKEKRENNKNMKDVQDCSASSHEDLQEKSGDPIDVGGDGTDSDEEENLSNEDVQENLPNKHGDKIDQVVSNDAEIHSVSEETNDDDEDHDDEEEDSDASACALEDDTPVPFMPSLDFNLAGGVLKLLSGGSGPKPDDSSDLWKIDEKDRYNIQYLTSRYFAPRPIQCRNCRKNGHLSRDCPEPLRQRCIFCCEEGHQFKTCPQAICHNCSTPGHKSSDCREPRLDWNAPCDRCWMTGHTEQMCPDKWRQLHLSLNVDDLHLRSNHKSRIDLDEKKNTRSYCYNCGKKGHLGYECRLQRMNRFVAPSYPFVAYYDRKSDILRAMATQRISKGGERERKERRKKKRQDKASKHSEKSGKFKELEQGQHNRGKMDRDLSDQYPMKEKKDLNKRKHQGQESKCSRSHGKEVFVPRHSSELDYDRMESRKLFSTSREDSWPSTSRSHQKPDEHNLFKPSTSSRSLKSRKRQWIDASPEVESEDSFEDMVQHQVSRNEWWLDGTEAKTKHRKKVRETRRDIKAERMQDRNSPYNWEDPEVDSRHEAWRDKRNIKEYSSNETSSVKHPETTFVYVDEHPYSFNTHDAPHPSGRRGHPDSPMYSHTPNHHSDSIQQQQRYWDNQRSPPRAHQPVRHSKSHNYINRNKNKGRNTCSKNHDVHADNEGSYSRKGTFPVQRNSKSHPQGWKHNASGSWPGARKKQRTNTGSASPGRGFKSRHERFVTMKNDCDIIVSMRK